MGRVGISSVAVEARQARRLELALHEEVEAQGEVGVLGGVGGGLVGGHHREARALGHHLLEGDAGVAEAALGQGARARGRGPPRRGARRRSSCRARRTPMGAPKRRMTCQSYLTLWPTRTRPGAREEPRKLSPRRFLAHALFLGAGEGHVAGLLGLAGEREAHGLRGELVEAVGLAVEGEGSGRDAAVDPGGEGGLVGHRLVRALAEELGRRPRPAARSRLAAPSVAAAFRRLRARRAGAPVEEARLAACEAPGSSCPRAGTGLGSGLVEAFDIRARRGLRPRSGASRARVISLRER